MDYGENQMRWYLWNCCEKVICTIELEGSIYTYYILVTCEYTECLLYDDFFWYSVATSWPAIGFNLLNNKKC